MCSLFAGIELYCQTADEDQWTETYYGTDEGLPNRTVWGASRDNNQLMWVGTDSGLCLLDGYGAQVFNDFPQRFNGDLKRDDKGFMLATFEPGSDSVEIFNPATFEASGVRLHDPGKGYFCGISHQEGKALFFALGNSVYAFSPGSEAREIHSLRNELQPGDHLVFADSSSYLIYNKWRVELSGSNDGKEFRQVLPYIPVTVFHKKGGGVLLSGEEGFFEQASPGGAFTTLEGLPSGKIVNFIYEDDNQNFLVGYIDPHHHTVSDLHLMRNGQLSSLSSVTEFEDRIISISGTDFRESMQLHTHGGLFLLDRVTQGLFRRYLYRKVASGKFGDVMRGFAADNEGNVYVNKDSRNPHWFRVDALTQQLDTLTMKNNDGSVADHFGCGTNLINYQGDIFGHSCDADSVRNYYGYVYRYRPADASWKRWPIPEKNQVIRWITNGRTDDELLLITEHKKNQRKGRLYYFYPEENCLVGIQPSGPKYSIHGYTKSALRDTARNCLWIGTDQAFYRFNFDTEKLYSYTFPDQGNTTISDVYLTKGNELLLGTFRRGLQYFDVASETFTTVGGVLLDDEQPPGEKCFLEVPSNDIAALRSSRSNELLVSTFKGLVYHDEDNNASNIFTTDQGLPDNEFNTPSLFYADSMQRWFAGTINGFVSFKTEELRGHSPYSPVITALRTVDEEKGFENIRRLSRDTVEQIYLKSSILYFSLDFTMPDYSGHGERRYQTFLEGFDLGWTTSTTIPSVRYARLGPGKYTFKLRAYDTAGRMSPVTRELNIVVLKPWYLEFWFCTLCAVLIILTGYFLIDRHLARLRKDIEAERKLQSLELRSLRQQINPHFISNAMNAIREYVRRRDVENPTKYLTDFSLMMRQFLESSRHRFTTVSKEMDMLQRYVGLEQLRFPDKFTAQYYVDPAIDPDMDEVPSLLLQPLVENAIEHGLRPLSGGGELCISIELDPFDDDVLICTVSDNGVGRKISAQSARHPGHVSRATQILEDRRAVLERDARVKLSVITEDLFPEKTHTGTVVSVRIEGS